jgi:molybdopterin converting factor small subunit
MSIEIIIPPFLQRLAGDAGSVHVNGSTVGECLGELVRQYPGLKTRLFTGKGELRKSINIFINGKTAYPGERDRTLQDADKIYITSIIMGG